MAPVADNTQKGPSHFIHSLIKLTLPVITLSWLGAILGSRCPHE